MSGALKVAEFTQPESFAFEPENMEKIQAMIKKYPEGQAQSAVLPALMLAQQQHGGWLPVVAIEEVASLLGMPYMKAYEVASFYTMYNLAPIGRHHIQVCTTTPCWLRGSDEVMRACKDTLGIGHGETTADGEFTLTEVECLGACVNAPMLEVTSGYDDKYYEDLNYATTRELLQALAEGRDVKEGSQAGRNASEPATSPTVLTDQPKAD
jgi:NADH dehydrogenase (ubiquinone) flavoprotein 2